MTRRDFGARLSGALLGIVGFVTMSKPELAIGAQNTEASDSRTGHIQNRRLFNFAAGAIVLADWERTHLHECNVCQEMAYVLTCQSVPFRI